MIEIDPIELISEENRKAILEEAKKNSLPLVVYALKLTDQHFSVKRHAPEAVKELVKSAEKQMESVEAEVKKSPEPTGEEYDLTTPLADIEFSEGKIRTGPLESEGIVTIADFLSRSRQDLAKVPRFGSKSLDAIVDFLMDEGFIVAESQLGEKDYTTATADVSPAPDGPPPVSAVEEEAPAVEEAAPPAAVLLASEEDFDDLPRDLSGIKKAGEFYSNAWSLEGDEARNRLNKLVSGVYDASDPDTIEDTIRTLWSHMPLSPAQYAQIIKLGAEIGEDTQHTTITRPEALCGRPLKDLNVIEANTLIEELEGELVPNPFD